MRKLYLIALITLLVIGIDAHAFPSKFNISATFRFRSSTCYIKNLNDSFHHNYSVRIKHNVALITWPDKYVLAGQASDKNHYRYEFSKNYSAEYNGISYQCRDYHSYKYTDLGNRRFRANYIYTTLCGNDNSSCTLKYVANGKY